jgi:hypothetical protein
MSVAAGAKGKASAHSSIDWKKKTGIEYFKV